MLPKVLERRWAKNEDELREYVLLVYSMTKTRTISLDLQKAKEAGATILMQSLILTESHGPVPSHKDHIHEAPIIPSAR